MGNACRGAGGTTAIPAEDLEESLGGDRDSQARPYSLYRGGEISDEKHGRFITQPLPVVRAQSEESDGFDEDNFDGGSDVKSKRARGIRPSSRVLEALEKEERVERDRIEQILKEEKQELEEQFIVESPEMPFYGKADEKMILSVQSVSITMSGNHSIY